MPLGCGWSIEIEVGQTMKFWEPCSMKKHHVMMRLRTEMGQQQEWWGH